MEQLPNSQQNKKWKVGMAKDLTGYLLLLFLDPDQLLAEVLEDEGEEPVAVEGEGVALLNTDHNAYQLYCYISCRGT